LYADDKGYLQEQSLQETFVVASDGWLEPFLAIASVFDLELAGGMDFEGTGL
jgi:hypothetical protein